MKRRPGLPSWMWLLALHAGCGDRVLGGITPEGGAMGPACEAYVPGRLVQPGVSIAEYCSAVQRICGFGDGSSGAIVYTSLADCMEKYGAASGAQRSCSAGHVCEAEARASSSLCEGVVSSCAGL